MDSVETFGHAVWTISAVVLANWATIGAATLMIMQGMYLFYKIRKAKKECKE